MDEDGWTEDSGSEDWRFPLPGPEDLDELVAELEREVESRGVEAVAVDLLVVSIGKPQARVALLAVGPYVRGDPALAGLLERLRALRSDGVLTDEGYFYLVSTIMEEHRLTAAAGDPAVLGMLEWIRAHRKPDDPDAMPDREGISQSEEWREVRAEHIWRCHLALMEWLRELGEYEMAFLAEHDPGMYERKRIAGEGHVCGSTRISLERCPENDGVRGYRDPLC